MKLSLIILLSVFPAMVRAANISTHSFAGCAFPDTGQSVSYTTTFGEDHDYAYSGSTMSFTIYNGVAWGGTATSSVTVDNRTGLMWVTNPDDACAGCAGGYVSSGTYIWENALKKCENLAYAGFFDWRLPNVRELMSIMDYTACDSPRINTTYFPNTDNNYYWTSTTYAPDTAYAWFVDFNAYDNNGDDKLTDYYIRCVRAGP